MSTVKKNLLEGLKRKCSHKGAVHINMSKQDKFKLHLKNIIIFSIKRQLYF